VKNGAITGTDLINVANYFAGQFWLDLRLTLSTSVQLVSVKSTDLTTAQGADHVSLPVGATAFGAVVAQAVPNNVALVVTQYTNKRGKSYRGRTYVPGMPITRIAGTIRVTNQQLADVLASFTRLVSGVTSLGMTLVVLSKFVAGLQRPSAVLTPVTTMAGNVSLDSQRRRLEGRGS
jgi:hypothetical protein